MPSILELSERADLQNDQTAFNLAVWQDLLADSWLAGQPGRIETNSHGQIVMSPPPAPEHGQRQFEIAFHLQQALPKGRSMTECPLSTSDGVKGIDVAWMSVERLQARGTQPAYTTAPEICAEVISPSNTRQEMAHKKSLYFEAGALEVWFCSPEGAMSFYLRNDPETPTQSRLVPDMPLKIETI